MHSFLHQAELLDLLQSVHLLVTAAARQLYLHQCILKLALRSLMLCE